MVSKYLTITAQIKRHPALGKQNKSDSAMVASVSTTSASQHYNDWPNAVGFDTTYEEHEPVDLAINGHIPVYAAGTLFRTGIGQRSVTGKDSKAIFKMNHWFDGFSQVHRFQLHAPSITLDSTTSIEKITYNSRLTSDRLISRIEKTGKLDDFTFGAKYEPCKTFFQKVQSVFEKTPEYQPNEINNAVTLSINYPGLSSTGTSQPSPHSTSHTATLCNKTDSARMQFLDPETLSPTGIAMQTNLHPLLKGPFSSAHAEVDTVTHDTFNFNMDFTGRQATFRVFRNSASTGRTSILTTILHAPAYLHSLFLTEHFVILCIWNSHFSKAGASIMWHRNIVDALYFNTSPAMWYVIDRRCPETEGGRGVVAKFTSDPFFAFHTVNAYEVVSQAGDGTVDILCDICVYGDTSVLHHYYMDNLQSSNPVSHEQARRIASGKYANAKARLRRYRLSGVAIPAIADPLPAAGIRDTVVEFTADTSDSMELPTLHPAYAAKKYRYIYGIMGPDGTKSTFVDGLVKYDLESRSTVKWEEKGQTPGEAIFVPKPGAESDEDDGVLLSVVLDGYTGKSYLLCLNAKDMKEVGRAMVDGAVGFGFHGVHTRNI